MTPQTPQHFTSLSHALDSLFGNETKIVQTVQVTGGDINQAYRLTLSNGAHIFMKSNAKENLSFFTAEAAGLSAIARTNAIGTPRVLCSGIDDKRGCAFLLMEYIDGKRHGNGRIADYWETFAHQLAAMHRAPAADLVPDGTYGFADSNYIGARKQINTAHDSWKTFFRECRLKPQFKSAARYFHAGDLKKTDRLLERTDDILVEPEYPSLLHGDLWSGNVITGSDRTAWLIDPAVYAGHAEADLAMTELFGGFPQVFYDAYKEAAPLQPGYEYRRDFYNLYHLLNHLNMFGRGYYSSVMRIVNKCCN